MNDIANRIYIKKQNLNLIIKDLKEKDIIKNDGKKVVITNHGNDLIEKTIKRINEKIIKIFQKTDPKNMAGFINIIESL
jgi:DNA-binding MarR family transcriptional regulator